MCLDLSQYPWLQNSLVLKLKVVWNMNTVRDTQNSDSLLKKALSQHSVYTTRKEIYNRQQQSRKVTERRPVLL